MVRITNGQFLAVSETQMVEIHAKTKEEAREKAKRFFENEEYVVCKIPGMINYLPLNIK